MSIHEMKAAVAVDSAISIFLGFAAAVRYATVVDLLHSDSSLVALLNNDCIIARDFLVESGSLQSQ